MTPGGRINLLQVRRALRERWADTDFILSNMNLSQSTCQALWTDGPRVVEVEEFLSSLDATSSWEYTRDPSRLAWALLRGPHLPDMSTEIPWDLTRITHHLDQYGFSTVVDTVLEEFESVNLENLHVLTTDPHLLARAEIAATLGRGMGRHSWEEFELWLVHGGWAMTLDILGEDPARSETVRATS